MTLSNHSCIVSVTIDDVGSLPPDIDGVHSLNQAQQGKKIECRDQERNGLVDAVLGASQDTKYSQELLFAMATQSAAEAGRRSGT